MTYHLLDIPPYVLVKFLRFIGPSDLPSGDENALKACFIVLYLYVNI